MRYNLTMDWIDQGLVLSARRHGENALIVSLLTRDHGRHVGLVRGGASSRHRGLYQAGNRLRASWRARLAEHLGTYGCEMERAYAAGLLHEPVPLLALSSATAIIDMALPERAPFPGLFNELETLVQNLGESGWEARYVRWELALLVTLGFGLDLTECAATGGIDDLVFVSPKSGRAVSAAAGEAWRDRLLPLPAFLIDGFEDRKNRETVSAEHLAAGLKLTGYFLARHVLDHPHGGLPAVRERLAAKLGGRA
jgi:DNA repair protein RecO (recombination protein O)